MAATKTEKIINDLKPEILKVVTEHLTAIANETHDVAIAWKKMQDDTANVVMTLLGKHLPTSKITSPKSKSVYPDIKIINEEGTFAIDIKVNEDSKNPWFDMARLDTMLESRIAKYVEEWELVIQFRNTDGKFIKAYFNLFREVVGNHKFSGGIKYRPYDGKVRPKTWSEFDKDVIYWDTKEKFLDGVEKSIKYRWKSNISKHLVAKLSAEEKEEFKKLFDTPLDIPEESDEDENGDVNPDLFNQK
ncbi:MAG: hypothetical protein IPN82_14505 [Chitinophagaceae bacterium]|nr:hypothetical protein [Chitinophagaceae bacterium]MBP6477140.1 hypothetical protein [Chitinophagaceae bacterium]MBP7107652.1 hypothetical protein [Chitinophagaceae bacterium]MBP7314510.1 hypothetical protein [Chitinophagaceae bacterium]HQZ26329.1 hypothetical protein [Flavobacterium sp.]